MLANRIKKNLQRLKGYIKDNNITCYRVYDRDIPELPYQIDFYDKFTIVYERGRKQVDDSTRHKSQRLIKDQLHELNRDMDFVVFKQRSVQKKGEQYEQLAKRNERFIVHENGLNFYINPYDYLDVGLFLDHRPLRKWLGKTKGSAALNLFCYTGSISVVLAHSNYKVTSVDLSATYLNWAQENFQLNNITTEHHQFIQQDVFTLLKEIQGKKQFDLIVLDPPVVSKSKRMQGTLDIQRDHVELIKNCMILLKSNGCLFFSNNLRTFKIDQNIESLFKIEDISLESIPPDFKDKKIHQCFRIEHLN